MADNKTQTDRIHDLIPKHYKTRENPGWSAIIGALGEVDQEIADLIEEVRKQFFVKTASRPYIDRLAANYRVSRPKFIGMQDADFRRYIPILAYQPKQVKLVIDQLLDVFFFKESTTAYTRSVDDKYYLEDGWELEYEVDSNVTEMIRFTANDFTDITTASADEVVSAINRQATKSFAVVHEDNLKNTRSVKIFTDTVGSKGALRIVGGRANLSLQFTGFNSIAGGTTGSVWTIDKVGDTTIFTYVSGTDPGLSTVTRGDTVIIDLAGNNGSFVVDEVNAADRSFTFSNPFSSDAGSPITMASTDRIGFFSAEKMVVWTQKLRAIAWEVTPGEIVIEIPASPPIVKRQLSGSAHINGWVGKVTDRSANTLTLDSITDWPDSGKFVLQIVDELNMRNNMSEVESIRCNSRFDKREGLYSYTSIDRNSGIISGITPDLPEAAGLIEVTITSAYRSGNLVTVVADGHGLSAGDNIKVSGTTPTGGASTFNGVASVITVISDNSFTYSLFGTDGAATGGMVTAEKLRMANDGSLAYLTSAPIDTGTLGPYMWDLVAPFVVSSIGTKLQMDVKAGNAYRAISVVGPNDVPTEEGYLVFDYGTEREEGPVRYLYKANENTLSIDPAYVFKNNHDSGSAVSMIRRRGPHVMSGLAKEYPLYVTDPAIARTLLRDLISQVKSVGIFLNFIVRYPEQFYATQDVYQIGIDPG